MDVFIDDVDAFHEDYERYKGTLQGRISAHSPPTHPQLGIPTPLDHLSGHISDPYGY